MLFGGGVAVFKSFLPKSVSAAFLDASALVLDLH